MALKRVQKYYELLFQLRLLNLPTKPNENYLFRVLVNRTTYSIY